MKGSNPDPLDIQKFNRELDMLMKGREPAVGGLPDEDWEALKVAQRLLMLDLSASSRSKNASRSKLIARKVSSLSGDSILNRLTFPTFWVPVMVAIMLFFGWLYTSLEPLSPGEIQGKTTALIQSTIPTGAVLSPQPIPTPQAPRELSTRAVSTTISIQTLPQRNNDFRPTGAPHAAP